MCIACVSGPPTQAKFLLRADKCDAFIIIIIINCMYESKNKQIKYYKRTTTVEIMSNVFIFILFLLLYIPKLIHIQEHKTKTKFMFCF